MNRTIWLPLQVSISFALLVQSPALGAEAKPGHKDHCTKLAEELFQSRNRKREAGKKLREIENEITQYEIANQSGTADHRTEFEDPWLKSRKDSLKTSQASLLLLERIRASILPIAQQIDPSLNEQVLNSYFEPELKRRRESVARDRDFVVQRESKYGQVRRLDSKTRDANFELLAKEQDRVREEISKEEDHYSAIQDAREKEGCVVSSQEEPQLTREKREAELRICKRLNEAAEPANQRYRKAADAERAFLTGEYFRAELVAKAESEPAVLERAQKRIQELALELAVETQKEKILLQYRENPEANAWMAVLVRDRDELLHIPNVATVASRRRKLEAARLDFAQVQRATEIAKAKSVDEKREEQTRLDNRKTALETAKASAWSELERAKEPYSKRCITTRNDLLYEMSRLQGVDGFGYGAFGSTNGIWGDDANKQIGLDYPSIGVSPGPAPGNYR